MKKAVGLIIIFAVLIYILPFAALFLPSAETAVQKPQSIASQNSLPQSTLPENNAPTQRNGQELLILDEGSGNVLRVTEREFMIGAVAAEMPLSWNDEALKAQAVAAHSYSLALVESADPADPTLKGAYFKASPSQRLGFLTDDVMKLVFGDGYNASRARLEAIADEVFDEVLTFGGKPALACYHAISNGNTISSAEVWGSPVVYLTSVDSTLDVTSPDYEKTATMSAQSVAEALKSSFAGIELPKEHENWFKNAKTSPEGYITEIDIGKVTVNANDLRSALKLRSTDFTIECENDSFIFTTRGYGHGVGMSQYGAQSLALTGKSYKDILAHYYPGAELTKMEG